MKRIFPWCVFLFLSAQAKALCVSSFQTRLRTEPRDSAKVSWVVGRYMPLVQLDRRGGWIRVQDLDGEIHWVPAKDVTSKGRCIVVKTASAQLRTKPSSKSPAFEIPTVDKYTAFKRLESEADNWYWVEDEVGNRAWVRSIDVWRPVKVSNIGF